jgi:uncharacterized protein involved in outer membrane biogenesis
MPLQRRSKIALAVAALIVGLPVIALIAVLTFDWNRARPWLNGQISTAIGRPFAIAGTLALSWNREDEPLSAGEPAWHDRLPWPHLIAKDVHIGNPPAMKAPPAGGGKPAVAMPADMASAAQFSFSLNPFALLFKTITIPVLRFDAPVVYLQRDADGKNNWTFGSDEQPSAWTLDVRRVVFTKGSVRYIDAATRADIVADVDTINADPAYGVSWKLHGTYNGEPVTGGGKAGAVLSLERQTTPYPLAADIRVGNHTALAVSGTLTRPTDLAALDMRLKVSGPSMARLYGLTGLVLPETPPFTTEGHLSAALGRDNSHWTYDKFTGKVGSSDINGRLEYQSKQPRGLLSGTINSRLLVFHDLGPLIGADSNASKTARGVAAVQPSDRVLPVETFRTERWTTIDTDVNYTAGQITRDKDLPISNLSTHIVMQGGVLTLQPLNFDIAGGKLASNIRLDGSGKIDPHAIRAELKASVRHLEIQQLFPKLPNIEASVGEVNGDAALSATGNSVASLLGSSNGEARTLIDHGQVSKLLLEEMGLNVGNIVLTKLFGDKPVKLNCMATDFVVNNGLMQTRRFIVDTDEAVLNVSGTINLADERLDLTLNPDTKSLRIFSLRSPLYVRGTFGQPSVSIDKGVLAARAGGAVALAVLAPVAALFPLINTGPGKDSPCAALLAEARIKPVAPEPGKSVNQRAAKKPAVR